MATTTPPNPADAGTGVRTFFLRSRNVLLASAEFSELYVDYYLHLADQGLKPADVPDAIFKRALAAFALHCASRPRNEMIAWTINFQSPLVNLFVTGDNETGAVAGRIFDEDVRELPQNIFYCDVVRGTQPRRRSAVEFAGSDPIVAAEKFYTQSEQRLARFFQPAEEEFLLIVEHPDCDLAWLRGLKAGDIADLAARETLVPIEDRVYRWHCGCNQDRMLEVLAPTMRADAESLFGGDAKIEIRCPRCGARYAITREAMEAYLDRSGGGR